MISIARSYNDPMGSSIVTASDGPEALLASRIPLETHNETLLR